MAKNADDFYRILSLDGGGAKGFYTLGALMEIEAMAGKPLHQVFDLIFGTSTGAIIASLLALGHSVEEVTSLYKAHVPVIMGAHTPKARSAALVKSAQEVFGDRTFEDMKTLIGVVATRWDLDRPMIFKGGAAQAHGRKATFQPGFGCSVREAVIASCSAYPFFKRPTIELDSGYRVELADGGYCASNPTLYAIAEAVRALKKKPEDLRVVSIGVGVYPEPKRYGCRWLAGKFWGVQLIEKMFNINVTAMDQLRHVLFGDILTIRLNDAFEKPEMATDLMETDLRKLELLYQKGRESFATHEAGLCEHLL